MSGTSSDTPLAPGTPREPKARQRSLVGQVIEVIVMIAIAFGVAQLVRAYVVQPFYVPTGSMLPTIQLGDTLLANMYDFRLGTPHRGDVVVLDDPGHKLPNLIKRVIAVGGQTVDVRDDGVWVDGVRLDEPYTHGQPSRPGTVALPVTLPADTIWVMGDNRTNSEDSRWFGPVPRSTVHAKAMFVYWPLTRFGSTFAP